MEKSTGVHIRNDPSSAFQHTKSDLFNSPKQSKGIVQHTTSLV